MIINTDSILLSQSITPKEPVRTSLGLRTFAFLLILFFIPVENILSETFIGLQEDLVEDIQEYYRSDRLDHLCRIMMYFGSSWIIVVIAPVLYHIWDCRTTLKSIVIMCMSAYFNSLLCLIQGEPRPFWVDSDIQAIRCDTGYGNPSKETMIGVTVFTIILIEFFHSFSIWIRVIAYSFVFMIQILLGLSAVYLGTQFPHQVLMSCVFAFVYLTSCFAFDKRLSELILKSGFSYSENRLYIIYWIIGNVCLLIIILTVFDIISISVNGEINLKWYKEASVTFIQTDCNVEYGLGYESLYASAFMFYATGIVIGSILSSKYLGDLWWATNYWKRVIRAAVSLGYSIGVVVLFRKIYIELIPTFDVTTKYIFHYVLPCFMSSFGYSGVFPYLFNKLNLVVPINSEVREFTQELVRNSII